jgi:hypothetical protein
VKLTCVFLNPPASADHIIPGRQTAEAIVARIAGLAQVFDGRVYIAQYDRSSSNGSAAGINYESLNVAAVLGIAGSAGEEHSEDKEVPQEMKLRCDEHVSSVQDNPGGPGSKRFLVQMGQCYNAVERHCQ